MQISQNSPDLFFWYNHARALFGPNFSHESLYSFFKDSFLFAIPLHRNALPPMHFGMDTEFRERNLQFGEAGSLEIEIGLHNKAPEELMVFVTGYFDVMVR